MYPQQPYVPVTLNDTRVTVGPTLMCAGGTPTAPAVLVHDTSSAGMGAVAPARKMFIVAVQSRFDGLGEFDGVMAGVNDLLVESVAVGVLDAVAVSDGVCVGVPVPLGVEELDGVMERVAEALAYDVDVALADAVGDCPEPSHGPLMAGLHGARLSDRYIVSAGASGTVSVRYVSVAVLNVQNEYAVYCVYDVPYRTNTPPSSRPVTSCVP